MPIYEYRCKQCGAVFDEIRPMNSADKAIPCHECKSQDTTRMLSTFFSHNQSGSPSSGGGCSCGSCSGGSCATCGH